MIIFEGDWIVPRGENLWYRVEDIAEFDTVVIHKDNHGVIERQYIPASIENIDAVLSDNEFRSIKYP